ncbi:MAG: hypothetical protein K8S56_10400 [Candidatus Cloacimonetes bacterium]|nr:hypothetical protein [Candidatus Cloacimonadota bacterium]
MNCIGIWYKYNEESSVKRIIDFHVNYWKLSKIGAKNIVDLGFFVNPEIVESVYLHIPHDYKLESINDVLNEENIKNVFNEGVELTKDTEELWYKAKLSNDLEYTIPDVKLLDVALLREDSFKCQLFKISFTEKLPESYPEQVYLRLRFLDTDNVFYEVSKPKMSIFERVCKVHEIFDIRINDYRILDTDLQKYAKRNELILCQFDKIHFLYMASQEESIDFLSSKHLLVCRSLETEKWFGYLGELTKINKKRMLRHHFIVHHWKLNKKQECQILFKSHFLKFGFLKLLGFSLLGFLISLTISWLWDICLIDLFK